MKILIGCERSGVIRDAFIALGHDAWSCDLEPSDRPGPHLQCDILDAIRRGGWDAMIAHPECTFLCSSGMHWTTRGIRHAFLTVDAIAFAEELWDCGIELIAIENPVGCLSTRSRLGKPAQYIQPYEFGDDASKKTGLWLKGFAPLKPTQYVPPRLVCRCGSVYSYHNSKGCPACGAEQSIAKPRWANQTDSGQNRLGPSEKRSAQRAQSYPGIAKAMATQWGSFAATQGKE